MSIVLYKPGNSYTSPKGVRCQFEICEPHMMQHLLEAGWFMTPEECYPEEKEETLEPEEKKKEKEETKEETPEPELPELFEAPELPKPVFDINSLYNTEPEDAE